MDPDSPGDDRKDNAILSELLREWQLPGTPPTLDARVFGMRKPGTRKPSAGKPTRKPWWSVLLTGSVRIPVPVAVAIAAILLAMALTLVRQRPVPSVAAGPINLADFQPTKDLNVRVIRGHDNAK